MVRRRLYFRAIINIERVADRRNVMKKRYCKLFTCSISIVLLINIIIIVIIIITTDIFIIIIIGSENSNTEINVCY